MLNADEIVFEKNDNFQKQTYRNRCYIYGANGKQLLNIPIQKISGKQLYKEVKIDYSYHWQSEHLKALYAAYNSSPFFEFYIDDLMELFTQKETFLMDLNIKIFQKLTLLLQENKDFTFSKEYHKELSNDYRYLVNSKKELSIHFPKYTQVFDDKYGFLPNLSILDLLFMEGTTALIYLNKVAIL